MDNLKSDDISDESKRDVILNDDINGIEEISLNDDNQINCDRILSNDNSEQMSSIEIDKNESICDNGEGNPKISKEMLDKILSEINMTEEDLEENVNIMKRWLTTQPHLPPSAQDENLLKSFIIACESVENAKKIIVEYYECRTKYQEPFFKDRDPQNIKWNCCNKFVRLPGLSPEGYIVNFMQLPDKSEVKDFDIIENCRASFMNLDITAHSSDYMNAGHLMICDGSNFSARLMFKCMFNIAGQSSLIVQKAYPVKIMGFVTFNAPTIAEFFFNTFMKPFLSEELKKRNYMHSGDHTVVKKYIPIEMLPCDYEGGQSPPVDQLWSEMQNKILRHRDWFLKEGNELINEELRPKETKK